MNFKIFVKDLLLYITWLYSVHFLGALPKDFNSLISIFLIILPALILFLVLKLFEKSKIEIKINLKRLFVLFIFSTIFILLNYTGNNLFNDELSYAQNSYKLVTGISIKLFDLIPYLATIKILLVYRCISIFLFLIPIYLIFFYDHPYKIKVFLLLLILFRFTLTYLLEGHVGVHPPMHSFISSSFTTLFGINDFNFKVIQCLPLILLIYYSLLKLRINVIYSFLLLLIISIDPFLGYFNLLIEQGNYMVIFTTLILILCYNKVDLKYISLIIGISLLFRNTLISLVFIPFIYNYFNNKKFDKKFFASLIPILIGFPTFFKSIIFGTPSTDNISDLSFNLSFNKLLELDLLYNIYNVFDYYLIFPFLLLLNLILLKRWDIMFMIFSVGISYIFLHFLSDAPKFMSKYYYEFIGSYLILFYVFLFYTTINYFKKYSYYIFFFLIIFCFKLSFDYKNSLKDKVIIDIVDFKTKNFNPILKLDNELSQLMNEFYDDLRNTIIFNTDYHGDFSYIMLNINKSEFDNIYSLTKIYNKKNRYGKIYVDINAIEFLKEDINYLIFTDLLNVTNKEKINFLLTNGWSIYSEKNINEKDFGWLVLKNDNFTKNT